MSDEIVNRVAKSNLITIDLEDLYPKGRTAHTLCWKYNTFFGK